MSDAPQKASFDLSHEGFSKTNLKPVISSAASANGNEVTLEPFGLLIAEVNQ
jgi:hypothetical protein